MVKVSRRILCEIEQCRISLEVWSTVCKSEATDGCRSIKQHRNYLSEVNAFQKRPPKVKILPGAVNKNISSFPPGALCLRDGARENFLTAGCRLHYNKALVF